MSQNAASQPPDGAPGSPMAATSGGDVAGEPAAAAFTTLAAADIGSLSADDALAVAEQARVVAGFALAMEAEATARLRETYPLPVTATDADRRRAAIGEVQVGYGWSEAGR